MAAFEVKVVKIDSVESHPDADRLSIVKIGGYNCISAKLEDGSHRYAAGDLVVYIPEAAVLPEWMLKKMGFWKEEENKGTLSGSQGNRVKCVKLRGQISQGILYPTVKHDMLEKFCISTDLEGQRLLVNEGDDVAAFLYIIKYEVPVPAHLAGEVAGANSEYAFHFDIDNIQKFDRVFESGEQVVVTEKLHGTFCALAYAPELNSPDFFDGKFFAGSKGLLAKGLLLRNNEANANNIYHRFLISANADGSGTSMPEILTKISKFYDDQTIYILGEVFGKGIQDLTYELTAPEYRVFDIYVGKPNQGRYLNDDELEYILRNVANLKRVPVLYRGPFSMEKMTELRDGNSYSAGKPINQIREGIVIKPVVERENRYCGRVALKFVSPNYLLRKNSDATEYQ